MTDADEVRSWPAGQRSMVSCTLYEFAGFLHHVHRGDFEFAKFCLGGAHEEAARLAKRRTESLRRASQTKTTGGMTAGQFRSK